MSYNFYFISGRNPASTIQALQQAPKAQPEPRPRPVLQLVDQTSPEIAPLTEANVQARTPDPRLRNRDILRQRAETIRDDASIRAPSTRRSRSHRSRSPGRQSTQVIGQIDFSLSPPNMDVPPRQWSQNIQGIWNQYGESTTLLPPVVTDPHCYLSSSSSITHAFPSEGPRSTLLESPASPLSNRNGYSRFGIAGFSGGYRGSRALCAHMAYWSPRGWRCRMLSFGFEKRPGGLLLARV